MCRVTPNAAAQTNFFGSGRTYDEMTGAGNLTREQTREAFNRIPLQHRFGAGLAMMFGSASRGTLRRIPKKTTNA
jgi:hypothetical protein